MSEQDQQETRSPLQSERGVTTVSEGVVSQIAGVAAGEVEGVHMGGGASRSAGGLLGRATGSSGTSRGVSVEVGQTEAAIDLKMGIEYGKNILQTVEDVRQRITDRVEGLTGLRIREINATVSDIIFPDEEERRREGRRAEPLTGAEEVEPEVEPREMPARELRPGAREREVTEVEPTSREHAEAESGPVPEEDVRVRDTPVREDETAEIDISEGEVEKRSEESGGPAGSVRRVRRGSSGRGGSGRGGSSGGGSGGDESGGRSER